MILIYNKLTCKSIIISKSYLDSFYDKLKESFYSLKDFNLIDPKGRELVPNELVDMKYRRYDFIHMDGRTEMHIDALVFRKKHNIPQASLSRLLSGKGKKAGGWSIKI